MLQFTYALRKWIALISYYMRQYRFVIIHKADSAPLLVYKHYSITRISQYSIVLWKSFVQDFYGGISLLFESCYSILAVLSLPWRLLYHPYWIWWTSKDFRYKMLHYISETHISFEQKYLIRVIFIQLTKVSFKIIFENKYRINVRE